MDTITLLALAAFAYIAPAFMRDLLPGGKWGMRVCLMVCVGLLWMAS